MRHIRLDGHVRFYNRNVKLHGFSRHGRVVETHIDNTRIGRTIRACRISIRLKNGVRVGIADINARTIDQLSGGCLAEIIIPERPGHERRLDMDISHASVIVFNT